MFTASSLRNWMLLPIPTGRQYDVLSPTQEDPRTRLYKSSAHGPTLPSGSCSKFLSGVMTGVTELERATKKKAPNSKQFP